MSYAVSEIGKVIKARINSIVPVFPSVAPQNTSAPYCVYSILSVDVDDTKDDTSWADTATILLVVYEDTYNAASTRANSIRTALDGFHGTSGGVYVDSVCFVTESDDYDDELRKYIKIQEYTFRTLNT